MADSADASVDPVQQSGRGTGSRLRLRPANESDRAFLRAVFESTRADEFAQLGWSAERTAALLAEQFSMQDAYYRQHYPHARFDVIMSGDAQVGRLYHNWHGGEARLIDIALMPIYRGAGMGTQLVSAFVERAAANAMPVVLYVEMNNPVQGLYRRLGFETVGENGVYFQMRRPVVPYVGPSAAPVEGLAPADAR